MTTTVSEYRARIDDLEHTIETLKRRNDDLETRAVQSDAAAERAVVESHLRIAAYQAGSAEGPVDAAVDSAMRDATWKVDSQGKLLRVLPDGQWDMTPDGQYRSASSWMRGYAKKMPSYFPNAKPSGSGGTNGASPQGGDNPWCRRHWNQTEQSKFEAAHGTAKADAMATAAGSSLYATTPPKEGN